MKKFTLLVFIAIALHSTINAQITKGSWMAGGSVGLTSSTTVYNYGDGNVNSTTLSISPKVGYFLIDHLAAGITAPFIYSHTHLNPPSNPQNYDQYDFAIGPFLRYYFLPAAKKANIFVEVSDQYDWTRYSSNITAHSYGNTFGFAAGPSFFLTPSVALECAIGYNWQNHSGPLYEPNYRAFTTTIGFQVYLPAKHHKA